VARARPALTRRTLLGWAGVGTATVAVGGASALSLRAAGQAVLTPSEGGAYDAWSDWQGRAGDGPLRFVRAAVLAANGHNTQPWRFVVHDDRVDLFTDAARGEGALDPLGRELHLSLGCALENLALSAGAQGTEAEIALLPDPANPTHVARAALLDRRASSSGELYDAIPHRHTNRYPFDQARPLSAPQLAEIDRLVDQPDLTVVWFTSPGDKDRFGDLTIEATRDAIADPEVTAVDHAWFRHSQSSIDAHKDGLNIDGAGLPDATVAAVKLLPGISGAELDSGFLSATEDRQVPTAAAFGVVCGTLPTGRAQQLGAGRLWQRIHLLATARDLAVQPMNQALERADRERASGAEPTYTDALAATLPAGLTPLMPFRIGYPTHAGQPSPRRPADDVTRHG